MALQTAGPPNYHPNYHLSASDPLPLTRWATLPRSSNVLSHAHTNSYQLYLELLYYRRGNGSSESDTFDFALSRLITFVQEYSQAILVHRINLRKRKGAPYQTSPPLTQDIIEPFNMARLARAFSRRPVPHLRQHLLPCQNR